MEECTSFFNQMVDLRKGRLDDQEQQGLFAHLADCHPCRELFDFHHNFAGMGNASDPCDPSDDALADVRKRVIDEIRISSRNATASEEPVPGPWGGSFRLAAAAAAILALLVGFSAGRFGGVRSAVTEGDLLVAALERTAGNHTRLRDVENSESVVSNVTVRPTENDRVVMTFDVSRHLEIERDSGDPLVNEVLVHAMLDQSSLGARLKAVSMAGGTTNGKVEEALIFAMVNDPALPVRLRAFETIAQGVLTDAVEEGLFRVLRHDDSVQMRMLAGDLLTEAATLQPRIFNDLLEEETTLDPAVADRLMRISNI